jgi:hypothetical protein
METLRDGNFMLTIDTESLAKGLRPSMRSARNKEYLVECIGAVGLDKVLQVLEDLENDRIDTSIIGATFPYPQIFVCTNMILVCGEADVYELVGGTLELKIGPVPIGTLWSVIDIGEFIYMSNGKVAILRSPISGIFASTTDQPIATAICNFNGQILIGSPDEPWI